MRRQSIKAVAGSFYRAIASLRLSVLCLLYIALLVIYGTFYQVDHGLYAAQERIFRSWFFFVGGFLPVFGLPSVLLAAVVNMLAAGVRRFSFRLGHAGLFLMHVGVVIFIVGSGLSSQFVNESTLTLFKGQIVSESLNLRNWDFSISLRGNTTWNSSTLFFQGRFSDLKQGQRISFPQTDGILIVNQLYENCQARGRGYHAIDSLIPQESSSEGNIPGIILSVGAAGVAKSASVDGPNIIVYGGVGEPILYSYGNDTLLISLLPERRRLPLRIGLNDFILETHPGTTETKKIQSKIQATGDRIDREVVISMNRPFRYKSFTFYQTGFSRQDGTFSSTLTVVENPMRFLPHWASIIIISGMLFHFVARFIKTAKANRGR